VPSNARSLNAQRTIAAQQRKPGRLAMIGL
jgi:hypothetical protein